MGSFVIFLGWWAPSICILNLNFKFLYIDIYIYTNYYYLLFFLNDRGHGPYQDLYPYRIQYPISVLANINFL